MIGLSERQLLAVFPAIIALLSVLGLAYWGEYLHEIPWFLIPIGAIGAAVSFALAWGNIRWLEKRIRRLEELERGLEQENIERKEAERIAASRATEYAVLLSDASSLVSQHLEEVRLPLHILLTTRFGDLTDSQEELLRTAQSSADIAHSTLQQLQQVADIDRGALTVSTESLRVSDIIESIVPALQAQASRDGVRFRIEADPAISRISGNHMRVRDALRFIIGDILGRSSPGSKVAINVLPRGNNVAFVTEHEARTHFSTAAILGRRLVAMQGGRVEDEDGKTVVMLPMSIQPFLA